MNHIALTMRQFVQENFLFGQELTLSDTDSFLDHGIIDSTGVLELVTFLESRYGFSVEDQELVPENLDSIVNLVRFVHAKRSAVAMET